MKFKVGVIGATGYIGTPYRSEIRESSDVAEIVALCARRQNLLDAAALEDGATVVTNDWREVVENEDVNFVIIATPDALHLEPMLACAEAGKHVLCEKPTGANSDEAYQMWKAYEGSGLGHYVPYWTRNFPVFERARSLVQEGIVGTVKAVIYRWQNPRPANMPFTWRDNAELSAAGSIADVGSHAYDTMRWILGEEATRVLTHAGVISDAKPDLGEINLDEALAFEGNNAKSTRKGTAPDFADIAFQSESGAVGSLVLSHATFLRKGLAPELEIHGTESSIAVDRIQSSITIARPDGTVELLESLPNDGLGNRFGKWVFPALTSQIAGEHPGHPDLRDGWRVQLFTDAAAKSAQTGTWVSISELDQTI